jgi:hypothetical protein
VAFPAENREIYRKMKSQGESAPMHFHVDTQWFNQHGMWFNTVVAYIPLVATVTTTFLSIVLARATLRYAEANDKSLALAREEFERQWSPELHVKLDRLDSGEVRIVVTNLARISVLLQIVQLRRLSMAVPSMRSFLNEPLVGGGTWTEDLGDHLFACTGEDFQGQIAACVTFYASGRLFRTEWFRYQIGVSRRKVLRLDPVNIGARRVRAIHGEANTRQELVKDAIGVSLSSV